MNNLTVIDRMTSVDISLVIGKRHDNVLRDIRDEISKLTLGGEETNLKFEFSEREDTTGRKIPCYILSKEGILQLAARYDAVVRAKLIDMVMKQNDPYKKLSPELQAIFITDEKVQAVENRVNKLENTMTIDYGQQEQLRELANTVVVGTLGGKSAPAYKKLSNKAFSELWNVYKREMQVNSYRNTAAKDFETGKLKIQFWKPSEDLELMIKGANVGEE